jgi:hypothetical protein
VNWLEASRLNVKVTVKVTVTVTVTVTVRVHMKAQDDDAFFSRSSASEPRSDQMLGPHITSPTLPKLSSPSL